MPNPICGATADTKTRGTITCARPPDHPGPHFTKVTRPTSEQVPVTDAGVTT
jgi:hypothetical protein